MALTEIDRSLIKRCLSRQPGAWKDFVDRFLGLFIHVVNHTFHAHSVRATPEDVDDLCSEIFVQILADDMKALRSFRGKSSLATYLTVIARRTTINRLMQRRRLESTNSQAAEPTGTSSEEIQRLEDLEEVEAMIARLPEDQALVMKLFHLEGRSYREISEQMGIPENTVGSILTRARTRVRDENLQV